MAQKHLVCQGAICQCCFGNAPDKLKVLTQIKAFINEEEPQEKLVATTADVAATFEKNTFGLCQMQPLPGGGYKPCQIMIAQWSGAYENITYEENNGHPLLEDSKAICPIGGKDCISIINHGQVAEITNRNLHSADPIKMDMINPFMDFAAFRNKEEEKLSTPDFDIKIELVERTFTPLGIKGFYGYPENAFLKFDMKVLGQGVDDWCLELFHKGTLLYKGVANAVGLEGVTATKGSVEPNNSHSDRYYPEGHYEILWSGFDKDDIYDSSILTSEEGIEVKITGFAVGVEKSYTMPEPIKFQYNEVDWADVKIDKNLHKIDITLRVNLQDGGAEGLENAGDVPLAEIARWNNTPPITSRTRSFKDLEKLALEGISYHWGRNQNHAVAKDVKINGEKYEVYVTAINTTDNAMDDIELVFSTNTFWGRSNNPGCVTGFKSFLANVAQYIPYIPLNETIFYNVGYVNNVYRFENHFLFKNDWFYIDDAPLYKNSISKVDKEFSYTSAHEIGHNVLRAYSEGAGGSADYSYKHKGSSGYSDTIPTAEGGFDYPKSGEIDLMKYYNNAPYFLNYDFERIVAENKDVLGLIWLTKISVK